MSINISNQELAHQFQQLSGEVAYLKEEMTTLKEGMTITLQQFTQSLQNANHTLQMISMRLFNNTQQQVVSAPTLQNAVITPISSDQEIERNADQKYLLALTLNNQEKFMDAEKAAREGLAEEKKLPNPRPIVLAGLNLALATSLSKKTDSFILPPPLQTVTIPPPSIPPKCVSPFPSHQEIMRSSAQQLLALAESLNNQGKYLEAEKAANEGITQEKKLQDPRPLVLAQLNLILAFSLNRQGKPIDTEKAAIEGLAQEKKLQDPRSSILAELNMILAISLTDQGRYMEAEKAANEGLKEERKSANPRPYILARLKLCLAKLLNDQGRNDEAEEVAKKGITQEKKSRNQGSLDVLAQLNLQLAKSLNIQRKYLEAEKAATEGLNEARKLANPRSLILSRLNEILQKTKEAQNHSRVLPATPASEYVENSIELLPLPEVFGSPLHADAEKRGSSHPSEPIEFIPGIKRRKK